MIESNDMVFHLRSDSLTNLTSVSLWLQGSNDLNGQHVPSPDFGGLLSFQTPRVQFVQQGLPRKLADEHGFEFASRINPDSTMAMGFVDQQTNASGPAAITTFVGNASAKLTSAQPGDYFDNGSIAHFSHVIEDLYQFYALPGQDPRHAGRGAVHRAVPVHVPLQPARHAQRDPLGRPPRAIPRRRRPGLHQQRVPGHRGRAARGPDAHGKFTPGNARLGATFTGEPRIGHEAALQQVSRAADSTPLHIRADGPGLDGMDVPAFRTFPAPAGVEVPAGSNQFKLQFFIYVPTADLFARMRTEQAAQQLQKDFLAGETDDNGLERHITATRRQNFLVPPRRHRAFPLLELAARPLRPVGPAREPGPVSRDERRIRVRWVQRVQQFRRVQRVRLRWSGGTGGSGNGHGGSGGGHGGEHSSGSGGRPGSG